MRWKSGASGRRLVANARTQQTSVESICADLQARGVDAGAAGQLAARIATQLEGKDPAVYAATLDGVALTHEIERGGPEACAGEGGELKEVARLMGAFATELSKLDETLEVLAAHLRRMRVAAASDETPRILH